MPNQKTRSRRSNQNQKKEHQRNIYESFGFRPEEVPKIEAEALLRDGDLPEVLAEMQTSAVREIEDCYGTTRLGFPCDARPYRMVELWQKEWVFAVAPIEVLEEASVEALEMAEDLTVKLLEDLPEINLAASTTTLCKTLDAILALEEIAGGGGHVLEEELAEKLCDELKSLAVDALAHTEAMMSNYAREAFPAEEAPEDCPGELELVSSINLRGDIGAFSRQSGFL